MKHAPVVPGSTKVKVVRNGVEVEWREALQWDQIGPHDHSYVLLPESGEITFGDGRRGRVPPANAKIKTAYQRGGGPTGNVAAGSLTKLLNGSQDLEISQPFPAFGGAAQESLIHAKARAVASLTDPQRAVTLQDFERLALATPGLPLGRAHALADYNPSTLCMPVAGSVTVVILPRCPDPRPLPSPEMLSEVKCYLERRRTLTTEVHVVAPSYTTVAVHAQLHTIAGANTTKLIAQARAELDRFFHPLSGGPNETGWPFGRDVYRTEVMAILNSIPGVTYVDEVSFHTEDGEDARCGNLTVCPTGLVASGQHVITVYGGNHCHE